MVAVGMQLVFALSHEASKKLSLSRRSPLDQSDLSNLLESRSDAGCEETGKICSSNQFQIRKHQRTSGLSKLVLSSLTPRLQYNYDHHKSGANSGFSRCTDKVENTNAAVATITLSTANIRFYA